MKPKHDVTPIYLAEARARNRGKTYQDICAAAELAEITWRRWRKGENAPNPDNWGRVEKYLVKIETA